MKTKNKILLFIPMYNCERQIVRVLAQLDEEIQSYLSKVIIVNNRSTDNGEKAVTEYIKSGKLRIPVSLLRNDENYGLGGSHKAAFSYAVRNGFDYVIVLHGDDQGHINNILPYLKNEEYKKYDCLLGARFMKGSHLDGYSAFRTFGNRVYNLMFSAVVHRRIFDLGSGLNMYSTDMLRDDFYHKYKDNLMFNYCMILGSYYKKLNIKYFPIRWSEDDQVSNVKMVNQAIEVIKILGLFAFRKKKFLQKDFRDREITDYTSQEIYSNERGIADVP